MVIVSSLGGLDSAAEVLRHLPDDFPIPVVFFQHGSRRAGSDAPALLLQRCTELPVRTAETGQQVRGAGVTVIPRGWTARIAPDYRLELEPADFGGGGDTLLRSAAAAAGPALIGVVLTGMLDDGAAGVREVKRRGGRVLAEDPRTARAPGMPTNAIATGCVDFALPNSKLAAGVVALALAPGGAQMFAVPTPAWATLGV